jgi:hypothetical protein
MSKSKNAFQLYVGRHVACPVDVKSDYDTALEMHFDFVVFPLVHPRAMRDPVFAGKGSSRGNAFTRSDLLLSTEDWSRCVVGEISEWIGCAIDSTCPAEAKAAEHALGQEVRWSQHLSVPAISILRQMRKLCTVPQPSPKPICCAIRMDASPTVEGGTRRAGGRRRYRRGRRIRGTYAFVSG